jgi:hypothetical protein
MQAVSNGQSSLDSPFGFEGCSLIAVAKKKARITARTIKGIISQVSKEVFFTFFANNFEALFSFFFQSKCCTKTRFKSHFWCEQKAYFVVIAYLFRLHCVSRILSFFRSFGVHLLAWPKPEKDWPSNISSLKKRENEFRLFWGEIKTTIYYTLVNERGNGELLELRLLETGFLSRFQLNP